ncbi:hypothetical protein CVT26_005269 [Gymnopilus dilepis]|uniref:Uncharacterized protein n=1 Tax=Gymnopilus dilepis TaxID=231916 RepID=A0A409YVR7_9AGAR|nr:hypothetical protein CVT26_005269 [Gymnopilus dilepis]
MGGGGEEMYTVNQQQFPVLGSLPSRVLSPPPSLNFVGILELYDTRMVTIVPRPSASTSTLHQQALKHS